MKASLVLLCAFSAVALGDIVPGPSGTPTDAPTGDNSPIGLCSGYCGVTGINRRSAANPCYCDATCEYYGDCCPAITTSCPNLVFVQPPGTEARDKTISCKGYCGFKLTSSLGSCYCDDTCADFNDCCNDRESACAASIVDIAVATDITSTLVSALTLPSQADVLALLQTEGPFTVFAPTNDGFAALGVDLTSLDGGELSDILSYHVLAGAVLSGGIPDGETAVTTLNGLDVTILNSATDGPCSFLDNSRANTILECNDGSICSVPADPAADSIRWNCCNDRGGRAKCPMGLTMCANPTGCASGQDHCCETDCTNYGGLTTDSARQCLSVNGAEIIAADIEGTNGVIHVIDAVLLPTPPTPSIVEIAIATDITSKLVGALTLQSQSAVLDALLGDGPFTVFAPDNAAFTEFEKTAGPVSRIPADDLSDVLTYHVVSGAVFADDIAMGSSAVTALNGDVLNIVKSDTDGPCTFLETTSSNTRLECNDGTFCTVPSDPAADSPNWSCCNDRGGRARCPAGLTMCANPTGCAGGQDHCCESSCTFYDGLRNTDSNRICLTVNDAIVELADIEASNGVVHVIDTVLSAATTRAPTGQLCRGRCGRQALDDACWCDETCFDNDDCCTGRGGYVDLCE